MDPGLQSTYSTVLADRLSCSAECGSISEFYFRMLFPSCFPFNSFKHNIAHLSLKKASVWDVSREHHRNMYIIYSETDHQPRLDA